MARSQREQQFRHAEFSRYRARWIYSGEGPPIRDAVITIVDGIVQALDSGDAGADCDLGAVALIPGLVNSHTHLEFSSREHPLGPLPDFSEWIRTVIQWRRQQQGAVLDSIRQGAGESIRAGVTTLGEIATSDWAVTGSLPDHLSGVVFRELLGLSDEAVDGQLQAAAHFVESIPASRTVTPGLSPHAPYSVHPALFESLCTMAESSQIPVAMHLAESPAELQLLEQGTGPLVELFQDLGVWREGVISRGQRPIDFLKRLARLPRVLVVHGNYLSQEEVEFLSNHPTMSVVYCPRTQAAMQGVPHPWQQLREAGVNVALGTDSRASNPDLSLWRELQFLQRHHPTIPSSSLLQLGTINGGRALGLNAIGALAPGYRADMCVVAMPESAGDDPESVLLHPDSRIIGVMQAGRWVSAPRVF